MFAGHIVYVRPLPILWTLNDHCPFLNNFTTLWPLWPLFYLAWERKPDKEKKIWLKILYLKRKYWKLIWITVLLLYCEAPIWPCLCCSEQRGEQPRPERGGEGAREEDPGVHPPARPPPPHRGRPQLHELHTGQSVVLIIQIDVNQCQNWWTLLVVMLGIFLFVPVLELILLSPVLSLVPRVQNLILRKTFSKSI